MTPAVDIHRHWHGEEPFLPATTLFSHRLGIGDPVPPSPFSAGIHPWDACRIGDARTVLNTVAAGQLHPAAIGETGVDRARKEIPLDRQTELFEMHLHLAESLELPVIIHCVQAVDIVLPMLKKYALHGVVFHGFIGSAVDCTRIVDSGYRISIGPASLRSFRTVDAVKRVPVSSLFIETDDSGENIESLYMKTSEQLEINRIELGEIMADNFKTLFPCLRIG